MKNKESYPSKNDLENEASKFKPKHVSISRSAFFIADMKITFFFILEIDTGIVLEESNESFDNSKRNKKQLFKSDNKICHLELILKV